MNIRLAAIPFAILLLAGCGSPAASDSDATASASPTASAIPEETEPAFKVSLETTCTQLLGQNEDGPFYETLDFVHEFQDIAPATITKARGLKEEIDGLALHAEDDLVPYLEGFASPMTEMIEITESGGTNYSFDGTEFKAAGTELVNQCTPYFPANASSSSGGSEEIVQPVPISGDYAADLAAIGVVPDDVTFYGEFMESELCIDPSTDRFGSYDNFVRMNVEGDPAMGSGVGTIRLAVAYFCPERVDALEASIEKALAEAE